jgi:hypothetical protein
MKAKNPVRSGAQTRWPTALDPSDPEGMADFFLGLGYDVDNVSRCVVKHCNLDHITAKRIVTDVADQQQGGQA